VDRELVEQARQGDREAFAVLVHQVSDSLYAVAYRILRDTTLAEDALQNALVLAWRRLPKLRDPNRFEAWIHRILVHACYDEFNRARSRRATFVAVLLSEQPGCPTPRRRSSIVTNWSGRSLASPSSSVRCSCCTTTSGLPLVEVAELIGIPAGTARSRLHYATARLREFLADSSETIAREGRLA
jgi:RNA polymerase sigma-70 factor (ECF subfamily)